MSQDKTGGPAFPNSVKVTEESFAELRGMTLRDYFAAKAMVGVCHFWVELQGTRSVTDPVPEVVAAMAYEMADAMLKARGNHEGMD